MKFSNTHLIQRSKPGKIHIEMSKANVGNYVSALKIRKDLLNMIWKATNHNRKLW